MFFLTAIKSALCAIIGVQSKENLERDFSRSNPLAFIVAGIIITGFLIGTLISIAKLIV
ncbi:DUF2970 domain-containing protein [Saccharophagus degradans]|uniref:DUF2970 domain-containing protein n=1 Tax=Saccharophagus degradans TaxID=86304 RepID=A0AAW7X9G9_9GAMM|nr:DUF2970 domain-containing protein [Saccharophagus degradans]MBU2984117.1 DUF2970 domain-containing protein [Saccharophagus degradans]MDO6424225.1 DUF2970 domain-containing protein [Saccharophagus degradans]MDO6608272.1 DUF2970 domain-containing protein [Saccharophagus degradans]WGO96800.1 DUF2970 domain-containing protein [Saccharophagus degradans]